VSSKTVTAAFEKLWRRADTMCRDETTALLMAAYTQGRREARNELKRQRQLEARRKRLTKAE